MFIEKFSNNGIPYLRLVQSQRFTKPDGSRSVRKKYIYNIGPLAKFDDGQLISLIVSRIPSKEVIHSFLLFSLTVLLLLIERSIISNFRKAIPYVLVILNYFLMSSSKESWKNSD